MGDRQMPSVPALLLVQLPEAIVVWAARRVWPVTQHLGSQEVAA